MIANRVFQQWRLVAYDFARRRLQDVRSAPMTGKPAGNSTIVPHDAAGAAVSIGAVYTSELANGLLLRWHVYRPRLGDRGRMGLRRHRPATREELSCGTDPPLDKCIPTRRLGIVNSLVGFAPLRPAEFVLLRIQQLAGQNRA